MKNAINKLLFILCLGAMIAMAIELPILAVSGVIFGMAMVLEFATKAGAFSSFILGANYTTTEILDAWAIVEDALAGKMNQNELRRPFTGALNAINDSTPNLILGGSDKLESIKKSTAQVTNIPVVKKLTATDATVRSCGTVNQGDSASVAVTYSTFAEGFSVSRLMMANNMVGYQAVLRHNLMETFKNLHQRLDVAGVSFLESNKSAVNNGSINTFNGPSDTMQVAAANQAQYFASVTTEMAENDFDGTLFNVHSTAQILRQMLQQFEGSGNQNNLAPQQSNFAHYRTNNFATPSGSQSGSYIFVPGTVGIIGPWINAIHREGADLGTDVFATINGQMERTTVNHLFGKLGKVIGRKISPHWMRHSHITHALQRGGNAVDVQEQVGHSSLAVTTGYAHSTMHSSDYLVI